MYNQTNGYGKRSMWQWILLYVIIGGAVYGIIYYFIFGKNGGYSVNTPTNSAMNQPVVPSKTSPAPTTSQVTAVLNTATDSSLGTYLVSTNRMTLYQYAKDSSGISNCSGQCAINWPPYIISTSESLVGGAGITGQISTILRNDGRRQIIYNGMPLYLWQGDSKSGDATGQNINGFSVVKP